MNNLVDICTKTIQNILSNFIPHQKITIDDPPQFNTKIKSLLQQKNKIYKNFSKDRNNAQLLRKLEHLQNRMKNSVDFSKHNYFLRMANKLNILKKNSKTYWSLLKNFLNNKKNQSAHQFYTIMHFVTNFFKKSRTFQLLLCQSIDFDK